MYPGFSLHEELALLVDAGPTPYETLYASTQAPAIYLDRETDLGSIEVGKLADMVLLDSDPISDIHNTTKIRAVVLNDKLLDKVTLDSMLEKVAIEMKDKD